MLIREAIRQDLPAMVSILNESIENLTANFFLQKLTVSEREDWFHGFGGRYLLLVMEMEEKVVGYGSLGAFKDRGGYLYTGEISIYVSLQQRGQGIGKRLMEELLTHAKENDFHTVISTVVAGNQASIRMHESFDFTLAGRLKQVGYKFDSFHDVLYYQKFLL